MMGDDSGGLCANKAIGQEEEGSAAPFPERIKTSSSISESMEWQIIHIPGQPDNSKQQSTVDVFASQVEPKFANTLVRQLNQVAPLENLRHVKRVRKVVAKGKAQLSVVLCISLGQDKLENISTDVQELIKAHKLHPFVTQVAKYAPSSKEEWEEQCKLWPTSYHPPTYNIDGITGFSKKDSQSIFDFMQVAIKLCKSGHQSNQVVNAAVIVDPSIRQVIASANDQTCLWPPKSKRGVESSECSASADVIANQSDANNLASKGPLDSHCRCIESKGVYAGVSCLHPWRWAAGLPSAEPQTPLGQCGSSLLWHPLHHAAIVAIEQAAARDRKLFPISELPRDQTSHNDDHMQSSSTSSPGKRQKTLACSDYDMRSDVPMDGLTSSMMRPYLCTGLDIYLVWEPCTMCAMALVHQRIRRIFFAFPNPNTGALGSIHRLQGERSLNHHYAVFRILLPDGVIEELSTNDGKP